MTETTGTAPAPDGSTPSAPSVDGCSSPAWRRRCRPRHRGRRLAASSNDDDPRPGATEQVAAAWEACQQWLDSGTASTGPGADWCDDMAGWMSGHMADGQMMMMGSGMPASPDAMRDVCREP